jgi:predicted PurR-regulated permease PerM
MAAKESESTGDGAHSMTDAPTPTPRKKKATAPETPSRFRFEDGGFLALVLIVTVAFALIVLPFFGAILWALVLAILFGPVNKRLLKRWPRRKNGVALLTLLAITLIVILPAVLLGAALIQELTSVYAKIQNGQIDPQAFFNRLVASLPDWGSDYLKSKGLGDFSTVRQSIANGLSGSFRSIAGQVLTFGQGAFNVVLMLGLTLYLTFFLLRDGDMLAERLVEAIPLRPETREDITEKFATVIRATIKGSLVVAIVQGALGGIIFAILGIEGALLWGVVMGLFSLIPAVGTGIVWVPVALYLFATGAYVSGTILTFAGIFVIGMVDNVLRPILVGRDTRMPDYVVLISTLGGLQAFGIHGFIIGPVVAALFIGTWNIFTEQWRDRPAKVSGA